jgi:hypothetical protein
MPGLLRVRFIYTRGKRCSIWGPRLVTLVAANCRGQIDNWGASAQTLSVERNMSREGGRPRAGVIVACTLLTLKPGAEAETRPQLGFHLPESQHCTA